MQEASPIGLFQIVEENRMESVSSAKVSPIVVSDQGLGKLRFERDGLVWRVIQAALFFQEFEKVIFFRSRPFFLVFEIRDRALRRVGGPEGNQRGDENC